MYSNPSSDNVYQDGSIRRTKFKENINIFRCPICEGRMELCDSKDMVCMRGHSFNISRRGYVNLLLKPPKTKYDSDMFHSRSIIRASGFFDPMLEYISNLIVEKCAFDNAKVLDAGCGEGSHLGEITGYVRDMTSNHIQGVGIDISKDGILIASKAYFDIIWCVADLARLPFTDKEFDVIINILSPSNYSEFHRTLKDDGILIKVIPGSTYLKELRRALYDERDKQTYSNDKIIEHYGNNFDIIDVQEILYRKKIDEDQLIHLIRMTPLSWATTERRIKEALDMKIGEITVDYTIITGKKREGL